MRISAISNTQNSMNFGRALNKTEIAEASQAALDARSAMGFKDGKGVLVISADKFPKEATKENLAGVKSFFETVKNLLGINSVEITGEIDPNYQKAAKGVGLKTIANFNATGEEGVEAQVKKALVGRDGLRISNAQNLTEQQIEAIEKQAASTKTPKNIFYEVLNADELFDWNSSQIQDKFKDRTVVGSSHYLNDEGALWGSRTFFTDRMHAPQGKFIHGLRKSSEESLASQMANSDQVTKGAKLLGRELDIATDEFDPKMFAAAKRADVVSSKHFYKNFDDLITNETLGSVLDFEPKYFEAVQNGDADNYFDSLVKVFRGWKMDESHKTVFDKLQDFRHALFAVGAKTVEEAQNLSADEIEKSYKDMSGGMLGYELRKIDKEKAAIEAQKAAELLREKEIRISKCKSGIKSCDDNLLHDLMNFGRNYKKAFAFTGAGIALLIGFKTLFSLGKEIGAKEQKAQPKSEKV